MLISILLLTIMILNLTQNPIDRQNKPLNSNQDICQLRNTSFKSGEKLTYKLYYNWGLIWVGAGYVVFTVEEDEDKYILKAVGKTYPSYNWFFRVEDYFYSHVDKNTMLPIWAKRDINEGGYRIINELNFNQNSRTVRSYVKKNDDDGKTVTRVYKNCMLDILSLMYKLRNLDRNSFMSDDKVNFPLILDADVYELSFQYQGQEPRKRIEGLGRFNTIKIIPEVITGRVFSGDRKMTVWISDDEAKVPLYLETPLKVGSLKAVLTDHKNLRHPLARTGN